MNSPAADSPLPGSIESASQLEELLSRPTPYAVEAMRQVEGDLILLGVAGKMGPTLARMAARASEQADVKRRVIGVSRFSNPEEQVRLEEHGIETIRCDLLDFDALQRLPDAPNVIFMAGMKFGSTGQEAMTWAMNTYLPGRVCEKYRHSRIAAFSTGNVYGLVPVVGGGSVETDPPSPAGDYAMSCLGRERIFQHFSQTHGTPVSLIRLNYACELRYGVLVDLAKRILNGEEIDLAMGNMNVIWQADANAMSLSSLAHAASPAFILNVAGPELLSVRQVCRELGERMNKRVTFRGIESPDALLNNAQRSHRLFGYPSVGVQQMIDWIAHWIRTGGPSLGKPTHFETRDGRF